MLFLRATHAPLRAHAWQCGHTDSGFAPDRESIRAAIPAFNQLHPEMEEEGVRLTLAYVALKVGTVERTASRVDSRGVPGDIELVELRG